MIEFVLEEVEKDYIEKYKEVINKIMMDYDIEYRYQIISKDTPLDILHSETFKVLLLNVEKGMNEFGIKVANFIRYDIKDWKSMIIFLTNNKNHQFQLWNQQLFILDIVEKSKDLTTYLEQCIRRSIINYDQRPNTLKYTYKNTIYNIDYSKIIYIEKEPGGKRCIVKTKETEYYFPGTLSQIREKLDNRFLKTNRSYIINLDRIEFYDTKHNILRFKSGLQLYAVSRNHKQVFMENIRTLLCK